MLSSRYYQIDNETMKYATVKAEESETESEYVQFDAYFLQNGTKVRGVSSELNNRPELNLYLNVLTGGRLENAKIVLTTENYNMVNKVVPDNEVSYASGNSIYFKTIENGTTKTIPILIEQNVVSNAYGNAYNNRMSKINSVTFTGTHVTEDGTRTNIRKTVDFTVDWYGSKNLERISAQKTAFVVNQQEGKVVVGIEADMYTVVNTDAKVEVPDKSGVFTTTIPTLNGAYPTEVKVINAGASDKKVTYVYNESTRQLTIIDELIYDEKGKANAVKWTNSYKVNISVVYPYSAYNYSSTKNLQFIINGYVDGYNNPNGNYSNPVRSATGSAIVNIDTRNPQGDFIIYDTKIDLLTKSRLQLYYDREIDTDNGYRVTWTARLHYVDDKVTGLIYEEDANNSVVNGEKYYATDHMQGIDGTYYNLDGMLDYTGIKVPETSFRMLGDDGFITVINTDTGDVIKTITANDVDKLIEYDDIVEHIRIVTSKPVLPGTLNIYNYKKINNEAFRTTYTKTQFDEMSLVHTALNGKIVKGVEEIFINRDLDSAEYKMGSIIVNTISRMQLNTQKLNQQNFDIILKGEQGSYKEERDFTEWVNPILILEYPSEIESINIKDVYSKDGELEITSVEQFESNGKKLIKINTEGVTKNGSNIIIDHSIKVNPNTIKTTGELCVFAYNELCNEWHYFYSNNKQVQDFYDINGNGNTTEELTTNYTELVYSKPTGIHTNTEALNFDEDGTSVMGPDIAEVRKTTAGTEATVRLNIYNNYNTAVTNAKVVGKIPFRGNTYQINGGSIGSNFTTTMKSSGISLPSSLAGKVDVYYSTNEIVNENLDDATNNWTKTPTDWSQVKTYLIDMSRITMNSGDSYTIDYIIGFPEELHYGDVSYATHAIYFVENSTDGTVARSTETDRVGFVVDSERKYSLQLKKIKQGDENTTVGGVQYKLTGPGIVESGVTYTTDSNGYININNLYPEEIYSLEETYAPIDYKKSEEPIIIQTHLDNGELKGEILGGVAKEIVVESGTLANSKVQITVENEQKYILNINKYKNGTDEKIKGVVFNLKGGDLPEAGIDYKTNGNGEISIRGLIAGAEYTLKETKTTADYILDEREINFIANRENGQLVVTGEEELEQLENIRNITVQQATAGEFERVTIDIENEPRYILNINKYKNGTDEKIKGVVFNLKGGDLPEAGIDCETNDNGEISIRGLIAGAEYTLKETKTTEDYILDGREINFIANRENGQLVVTGEEELEQLENIRNINIQQTSAEEFERVTIDIENEPKYILNINKYKNGTDEKIKGVIFNLKGGNLPETGIDYETNDNGEISTIGLTFDVEYTLKEVKANGYYIGEPIKFVLSKSRELNITGSIRDNSVVIENGTPIVKLLLENEKIPTYKLEVTKIKKGEDLTNKLSGALYEVYSEDTKETSYCTTKENGQGEIDGLYKYIEGKYITGNYILREMNAPEGYMLSGEDIYFSVSLTNGELSVSIENEQSLKSLVSYSIEGNVLKLVLQDSPLFTLKKVDKDTKEPVANAKFIIKKIGLDKSEIDYAKDLKGRYIGEKDELGRYIITTNSEGKCELGIEGGRYKIIEIEAPDKYKLPENEAERTQYFTAGEDNSNKIYYVEDLVRFLELEGNCSGEVITLMRTLDLMEDSSYRDANDITFGDYNGDGTTEGIKAELTNREGSGLKGKESEFNGTFYGGCNEIKNIYMNSDSAYYFALFGQLGKNGTVMGLYVSGEMYGQYHNYDGGIVGYNNGTVIGCYNNIKINVLTYNAGGITGYNNGTIIDCYNSAEISNSYSNVGGIVGNNYGTIINCYNTGTITGKQNLIGSNYYYCSEIGGIVGICHGTVTNCYNTGNVTNNVIAPNDMEGGTNIGGIVGNGGIITNCYNIGDITGMSIVSLVIGGIAGNGETITNCYNTGSIIGDIKPGNYGSVINMAIIGGIAGQYSGAITNCYNTGNITGIEEGINVSSKSNTIAGIVGAAYSMASTPETVSVTNCYYLDGITNKGIGYNRLPVIDTTESKDEAYMKSQAFVDLLNDNRVNEDSTLTQWKKGESYPILDINNCIIANKKINYIEDLLEFIELNYIEGELLRTLDFQEDESYRNPLDTTTFGDYNGDGKVEGIKAELTNREGRGLKGKINFYGRFSGNGNEIRNIFINGKNGEVSNLGLFNTIETYGRITGLGVTGEIINANTTYVGGIVGKNNGKIENSYSKVIINGVGENVGGIAGNNEGEITNCYNIGAVTGTTGVGGITGENVSSGTIKNCYNAGSATGTVNVGGIAGKNTGTITYGYYLNGQTVGGVGSGTDNTISKTGEEMKAQEFVELLNNNISDDNNLTRWSEGEEYPILDVNYEEVELEIENTVKEFKITTEVNFNSEGKRVGGSIIPGEIIKETTKLVEDKIKYGTNSSNEIVITPEEGYSIYSIKINDEDFKVYPDSEGKVIIPIFEDVRENYHIKVVFEKTILKYYINIKKTDSKNIEKTLSGAEYSAKNENTGEISYFTTDKDGKITIIGEVNYNDGQYISSKYTIRETKAPSGYSISDEGIVLNIGYSNDEFNVNIENEESLVSLKSSRIEGNIIEIILQDDPALNVVKVDKESKRLLPNAKFIIERINIVDDVTNYEYAKDIYGNYIGEMNEEGQYIVTTDEKGEIWTTLEEGTYRITEIEAPKGYELPEESERVRIFDIKEQSSVSDTDSTSDADLEINYIEDLIDFAESVNNGNVYTGKKISLLRNLDFNDDSSYRNINNTKYEDYNGDGQKEGIKAELTNKEGMGFIPIGTVKTDSTTSNSFNGTFLGNGFKIKNLYINSSSSNTATTNGLFRGVDTEGKILNLGLTGEIRYENAINENELGIGTFAVINNGTISNCYSEVTITVNANKNAYVGGIARTNNGSIAKCYNEGIINATTINGTTLEISGIARYNTGMISECYNTGMISANGNGGNLSACSAGITNYVTSGTVEKSYNMGKIVGNVLGTDNSCIVSGIAGKIYNNSNINNCYNFGEIVGKTNTSTSKSSSVGGIIGYATVSEIRDCVNKKELSLETNSGRVGGIVGCMYADGRVQNCYNTSKISGIGYENYIKSGGIVGESFDNSTTPPTSVIVNCYNEGCVYAKSSSSSTKYYRGYAGGIIGCQEDNMIVNTYNSGSVISAGTSRLRVTGGIIGYQQSTGKLYNSYNLGNIQTDEANGYCRTGGIVGQVVGRVENCYNVGIVNSSSGWKGNVVAYVSNGGVVDKSYYTDGTGIHGGTNTGSVEIVSSEDMKKDSFVNTLNDTSSIDKSGLPEGIEFSTWIKSETYPTLNINVNINIQEKQTRGTLPIKIEIENTAVKPIIIAEKEVVTERRQEYAIEGEELTYIIRARNEGTDGKEVIIKDSAPEGTIFIPGSIRLDGIEEGVEDKTEEDLKTGIKVSIPVGIEVELSFKVKVNKLLDGVTTKNITNTAIVDEEETNQVKIVVNKPNVLIEKSSNPVSGSIIKPGEIIKYSISLDNSTGKVGTTVRVKDTVPNGTEFVEGSVEVTTSLVGAGEIDLNYKTEADLILGIDLNLEAGEIKVLSFSVKAAELYGNNGLSNGGIIRNVGKVNKNTKDPDSKDEETNEVVHTYVRPVISYEKSMETEHNKKYVIEGEKITYTITITNEGGLDKDIVIKDIIPEGITFVQGSITTYKDGNNTISKDIILEELTGGISWNVPEKVGVNNGRVVLSFDTTVNELEENCYYKELKNTANVDEEVTNEVSTVVNKAEIVAEKMVSPEEKVEVGQELTYSIKVTNKGTLADIANIVDEIPNYTTYVPDSIKLGDNVYKDDDLIAGKDGIKTEKIGDIVNKITAENIEVAGGESITLSFKVKVNSTAQNGNTITNKANVNDIPTNPTENVVIKPIIAVEKEIAKINNSTERMGYVFRGDTITYRIKATNSGDLAGKIIIKDNISDKVELLADSVKIGNDYIIGMTAEKFANEGIEVIVPAKTAEVSEETIISFTVKVKGKSNIIDGTGVVGDVINQAKWKYANPLEDSNQENPEIPREYNTEEVKVPIVLIKKETIINRLTKDNLPEGTVTAKDEITYKITLENTGTKTEKYTIGEFEIRDTIPEETTLNPNLDFTDGQQENGELEDKQIIWKVIKLTEGEKKELEFTVTVDYDAVTSKDIVNVAYVNAKPTNEVETPYVKPTPKIKTEIVKTGDDTVIDGNKVYYKITYTGKVNDFAGKICVKIVDELPYRIDESKSELNGGKYKEELENKKYTITWELPTEEINTYLNDAEHTITGEKEVWLSYIEELESNFTNTAIATTQLKEPNPDNQAEYIDVGEPSIVENSHTVTVKTAYKLPETGRNGTTIFAIIGLMIIATAIVINYKSKHKDI